MASPHLYPVMFGQATAGLNPDPLARQAAREALDVLAATIRRGARPGSSRTGPPAASRWLPARWPTAWSPSNSTASFPRQRPAADFQAILRATVTGWQHATAY